VKVILDANVLISYLLAPGETRTVVLVVDTGFTEGVDLLVPPELIGEIEASIDRSAYLSSRISPAGVAVLIDALHAIGTVPPPMDAPQEHPSTRDADDDYLIGQALLHGVDYLITGDKDLLVLGQVENLSILSPAQFWDSVVDTL
jgi:uncharacterized protein